jgi:hypothetical protein
MMRRGRKLRPAAVRQADASPTPIERLRSWLDGKEPGPVAEGALPALAGWLSMAWKDLRAEGGGDEEGGTLARARWDPPVLTATMAGRGSFYRESRRWRVDVEAGTRMLLLVRRRALPVPTCQRPVRAAPLAGELVDLILDRQEDERLQWSRTGCVRVRTARAFPPAGDWTTQGRRKRLHAALKHRLARWGWTDRGYGWFQPPSNRGPRAVDAPPKRPEPRQPPVNVQFSDLQVCTACWSLDGPVHTAGGARFQRCRCRPPEETWRGFDFNLAAELCRCCGQELLPSGSRFRVWFCRECVNRVAALDGQLKRYAVPIGRHSVHAASLLRGDSSEVDRLVFTETWRHVSAAMEMVRDWTAQVVESVVRLHWKEVPARISVGAYLERAGSGGPSKERRFLEMLEYLQARAATPG